MKRSRKVSFIYIVILMCVSLFTSCNIVDSSINKPIGEFIPVLRFSVASDVHIEDDETTSLLIPQAECMNSIESYRADIYENGVLKDNCYALSGYIINPTPKNIKIRLGKLDITKEYIVKVYAVNAYGLCLKNPLIIEV